jgi:hypothetical protein
MGKGVEAEMVFVLRLISGLIYPQIWDPEKTFPPEQKKCWLELPTVAPIKLLTLTWKTN